MYFTSKFVSLLLAITAPAFSAQAAVVARNELAVLQVVLFDDINLSGKAYAPQDLLPGSCRTLPGEWLDRAESASIGPGFTCAFFRFPGCAGTGTTLSGVINYLPQPSLYRNIESLSCNKV